MRLLLLLARLHLDLAMWLTRRPLGVDGRFFGTMRGNIAWPFLVLITVTAPVEIVAVELLIPGEYWWLRAALWVAAVELTVLAWALYGSLTRHPMVVAEEGLVLWWGAFLCHFLPYQLIQVVKAESRRHPTGQFGVVFYPPSQPEAYLTNSSGTNVTLLLSEPVLLPGGWFTRARRVQAIHLGVDRPGEFVEAVDSMVRASLPAEVAGEPRVEASVSRSSGLSLLILSLVLEGLLAMFGVFWLEQQGLELVPTIGASWEGTMGGLVLGCAGAGLSILTYSRLAPRFGPLRAWRQWVEEQLVPFLEPAGAGTALAISVSAGVGEELFFRGAMQPALGLPVTALAFGLAHVGGLLRREALPLFLYTLLYGLAIGWGYQLIDVLWPLIVAHAAFDFLVMLYLLRGKRLPDAARY